MTLLNANTHPPVAFPNLYIEFICLINMFLKFFALIWCLVSCGGGGIIIVLFLTGNTMAKVRNILP